MDRRTKILIASRIDVAPKKKYGKAGFLDSKLYGLVAGSGRILPSIIVTFHRPIK